MAGRLCSGDSGIPGPLRMAVRVQRGDRRAGPRACRLVRLALSPANMELNRRPLRPLRFIEGTSTLARHTLRDPPGMQPLPDAGEGATRDVTPPAPSVIASPGEEAN